MFLRATAYTQVLCGNTWIESAASKTMMFDGAGSGAKIGTEICSCTPGQHLTTTTPKTCTDCTNGKYQDEQGFTGTSCTKECGITPCCSVSTNPPICDPLPNGNGEWQAERRVGSLGGVVDDLYQDYRDGSTVASLSNKPAGSMSTAEIIAKHGPIDTWDTSQVNNMKNVFYFKENINPDIGKWIWFFFLFIL